MVTKTITKKIINKAINKETAPKEDVSEKQTGGKEKFLEERKAVVKKCQFCISKKDPLYIDSATLKRFINDRAKISPRTRSGVCAKHQRKLAKHIKYSRHLGLLPFTPLV
jgi:small subunit ribosomal protein S18